MTKQLLKMVDKKIKKKSKGNSYIKAIVTGHIIEIYEYEKMPALPSNKRKVKTDQESEKEPNTAKNRQQNMQRARNNLRRLITANFDESSKFITLTFAKNETDVKKANYEFKKFIGRMRYRYGNFKYITVIEFQKRGAVHYHMISNLPYIENEKLREIWGHGFVKINEITHVDNVGAYMIKYMSKDNEDMRLAGLKSYQTSRGLERPIEIVGDAVDRIKEIYNLENKKTVFSSTYETEHLGLATYKEFNLKR